MADQQKQLPDERVLGPDCNWCGKKNLKPREGVCCDECYKVVMWQVMEEDDS